MGAPNPMPQATATILDFIRTQAGTFLVAVDRAPTTGTPAIARSVDAGVTWSSFATLGTPPNTARPTPGLTECDDGTVLVPTDGSAGSGFIFRSTDDGQNFLPVQLPPPAPNQPAVTAPANVYLKYFPILKPLFAYITQQGGGTGTTVQTAVYRSLDQGQSWGTQPVFTSMTSAPLPQQATSWMAVTQGETYWGVDSAAPANMAVLGSNLFQAVKSQLGQGTTPPSFWGRYIGRQGGNLTRDEASFLHNLNCKILLIWGGTTQFTVGTRQDGVNAATAAIAIASTPASLNGLDVPGGVWIYCNIEGNWFPTAEFFQGWFDTMQSSKYRGGVYGNTQNAAFNDPYCAAYTSATDPNMRNGAAPALLWTNQPIGGSCNASTTNCRILAAEAPAFFPVSPPCNPPITIIQYVLNITLSGLQSKVADVDEDVANGAGFASMW